jgi:hypothetical protein
MLALTCEPRYTLAATVEVQRQGLRRDSATGNFSMGINLTIVCA